MLSKLRRAFVKPQIGAVLFSLCAPALVACATSDSTYVIQESREAFEEAIPNGYDQVLAQFQATRINQHDLAKLQQLASGAAHEEMRFVFLHSFEPTYLIVVKKLTTDDGVKVFLFVSRFSPLLSMPQMVAGVGVGKSTIDNYFVEITKEEVDALGTGKFVDLFSHRDPFGKPRLWQGTNEPVRCTDGMSYFVEATAGGRIALIRRGTCDQRFNQDFVAGSKLLDLAISHIPMLADQLGAIRTEVTEHKLTAGAK